MGGAIYAIHSVTVTSATITGCTTGDHGHGGAIYSVDIVTVTSTTITGCTTAKAASAAPSMPQGHGPVLRLADNYVPVGGTIIQGGIIDARR